MIELEQVTKRYGDFVAVDDLTLTVNAGEIFGFLGVNGAGKTTTLRMLSGILKPTTGKLRICGFDVEAQAREAKRITGFIPDRPFIYSKLTGREFLNFVADLYEVDIDHAARRIEELLGEYRLSQWGDELIESYSHGMRQRLATCAALVHEPQVLIVDEPMVGLDPHGAKLLKESLRRYADKGMSILLSTHSLNVAEEVSDRLAIIHRGRLIAHGSLSEIRERTGKTKEDLEQIFLEITTQASEGEQQDFYQ